MIRRTIIHFKGKESSRGIASAARIARFSVGKKIVAPDITEEELGIPTDTLAPTGVPDGVPDEMYYMEKK